MKHLPSTDQTSDADFDSRGVADTIDEALEVIQDPDLASQVIDLGNRRLERAAAGHEQFRRKLRAETDGDSTAWLEADSVLADQGEALRAVVEPDLTAEED